MNIKTIKLISLLTLSCVASSLMCSGDVFDMIDDDCSKSEIMLALTEDNIKAVNEIHGGNTLLVYAIRKDREDVAKAILRKLNDCEDTKVVNIPDDRGYTPLYYAVDKNFAEVASLLLECGADVNDGVSGYCATVPLHRAAMKGYADIVKLLLEAAALMEPEIFGSKLVKADVADVFGKTPLHYAAIKGSAEVIKLLMLIGNIGEISISVFSNPNAQDNQDKTPLHYAAMKGFDDIVNLLLEKGASAYVKDKQGRIPLYDAVSKKGKESFPLEEAKEKSMNIVDKFFEILGGFAFEDNFGKPPYFYAVTEGFADVAKSLLDDAEQNKKHIEEYSASPLFYVDDYGRSLLSYVEDTEIARMLLRYGANFQMPDCEGKTPLHHAAMRGSANIVSLLLEEKGIDVNARDNDGCTPLDYAKNEEVKKLLLAKGVEKLKI